MGVYFQPILDLAPAPASRTWPNAYWLRQVTTLRPRPDGAAADPETVSDFGVTEIDCRSHCCVCLWACDHWSTRKRGEICGQSAKFGRISRFEAPSTRCSATGPVRVGQRASTAKLATACDILCAVAQAGLLSKSCLQRMLGRGICGGIWRYSRVRNPVKTVGYWESVVAASSTTYSFQYCVPVV